MEFANWTSGLYLSPKYLAHYKIIFLSICAVLLPLVFLVIRSQHASPTVKNSGSNEAADLPNPGGSANTRGTGRNNFIKKLLEKLQKARLYVLAGTLTWVLVICSFVGISAETIYGELFDNTILLLKATQKAQEDYVAVSQALLLKKYPNFECHTPEQYRVVVKAIAENLRYFEFENKEVYLKSLERLWSHEAFWVRSAENAQPFYKSICLDVYKMLLKEHLSDDSVGQLYARWKKGCLGSVGSKELQELLIKSYEQEKQTHILGKLAILNDLWITEISNSYVEIYKKR